MICHVCGKEIPSNMEPVPTGKGLECPIHVLVIYDWKGDIVYYVDHDFSQGGIKISEFLPFGRNK